MKMSRNVAWAVAKINFQHLLPAYIVAAVFFAVGIYNIIACLTGLTDNYYVDMANYLYVLTVVAPIIIVARNFKRIMHLNGSKRGFYWGALLNYCIIAAAVSLLGIIFFVLTEVVFGSRLVILNLVKIFGWWQHGAVIAFAQQFFFLLLVEVLFHTLTSIQNRWYGWLVDGVFVAIICIFIPVPELRKLLVSFFDMVIFHTNAMTQITCCLALSSAVYLLYLPILKRKKLL